MNLERYRSSPVLGSVIQVGWYRECSEKSVYSHWVPPGDTCKLGYFRLVYFLKQEGKVEVNHSPKEN